jgi:YfiH family protein
MSAPTVSLPSVAAPFAWRSYGDLVWLDAPLGDAHAAFSTRLGGQSEGPYESLNLGILTDDDPARVRRNRGLLADALGRDAAGVAMGRQVHGAEVQVRATPPAPGEELARVDAQIASSADVTPFVLVADCIPLALAGPGNVAMVHCGWRGVAAGIVERALAAVGEPVAAVIGPGIGACCYEVGDEVRDAFRARGHDGETMPDGRLDLALVVRRELERLGMPSGSISGCGLCTSCHPELFFSHRRDGGVTGRQAGLVWLGS